MIKDTSCWGCKHFNKQKFGTCKAFPEGIPFIINSGEFNHDKPLPTQKNNIVFESNGLELGVINEEPSIKVNEKVEPLNIDANLENADWTKQSWDLPKYKSKEFMDWLKSSGMTLEQFRKLPVYKINLANGKIKE